jgi:hypothetical protein
MMQTIVLLLLLSTGAILTHVNGPAMHSMTQFIIPGHPDIRLPSLHLTMVMGGVLVLLWIGGLIDMSIRRTRIRRLEAMILAKNRELAHAESRAYSPRHSSAAEIHGRVEAVARDTRRWLARIDNALREGGAPVTPESAVRKRVDARTIREMFPPTGACSSETR